MMSNKRVAYHEPLSIFSGYWWWVLHANLKRLMTILFSAVIQTVSRFWLQSFVNCSIACRHIIYVQTIAVPQVSRVMMCAFIAVSGF
jgi:hypothetical protein